MNPPPQTKIAENIWQPLYKIGGAAALIAAAIFRRNLDAEYGLLRGIEMIKTGPLTAPAAISDWFALLKENTLLSLILLNLSDLINYALVGLIFVAICAALWRTNPSLAAITVITTISGVTTYFATHQAFNLLALSNQYAATTDAGQRATLLSVGQAALTIHQGNNYSGAGLYVSFLLVSFSGLILSILMLHSQVFSRSCAWMGILANSFGLAYYPFLIFAPALTFIPVPISSVFLLVWYLQTGLKLLRLGKEK
jgi:hypothetical protein